MSDTYFTKALSAIETGEPESPALSGYENIRDCIANGIVIDAIRRKDAAHHFADVKVSLATLRRQAGPIDGLHRRPGCPPKTQQEGGEK